MHENLGIYGLEMLSAFLDLKEKAEDCNMCPPDTPERQERFEYMHGQKVVLFSSRRYYINNEDKINDPRQSHSGSCAKEQDARS